MGSEYVQIVRRESKLQQFRTQQVASDDAYHIYFNLRRDKLSLVKYHQPLLVHILRHGLTKKLAS
jgi:hypothetical protein